MNNTYLNRINPLSFLNLVSIQNRLVILLVLTLFSFAVIGGIYTFFNAKMDHAFAQNQDFSQTAKSVLNVQLEVLQLHATENLFLARRKPEIADAFDRKALKLSQDLGRLVGQVKNKAIKSELQSATKLLSQYKNGFDEVVARQKTLGFDVEVAAISNGNIVEAQNLSVVFSNQSTFMESRLNEEMEFGEAATMLPLMTPFYRSRQMADNLLLTGKQGDLTLFHQESKTLAKNITASNLEDDSKATLLTQLKTYEASVDGWFAEYQNLLASRLKLGFVSKNISRQFAKIVEHSEKGHMATTLRLKKMRTQTTYSLLIAALTIIAAYLLMSYFISRSISRPIGHMTSTMQKLAKGDVSVAIETCHRHEIGAMAKAISVFRDNANERRRLEEITLAKQEREMLRARHIEELVENFSVETNRIMNVLTSVTEKVKNASSALTGVANDAAQDAGIAQNASSNASQIVETVTSATGELSDSIQDISRQSLNAIQILEKSSQDARHIDQKVDELSNSAQKIGNVVGIIREIAEQTNLLALNATIESARAGEAGAGFAIVAQEVKTLAQQTADATQQISIQIEQVQGASQSTASDIGGITTTMSEIRNLTASIAAAVEQQDAATQDIARSVTSVSNHTSDVSHSITGVTSSIQETANEAEQMSAMVKELNDVEQDLTIAMSNFAHNISALAA